jgi:hypothetical protein
MRGFFQLNHSSQAIWQRLSSGSTSLFFRVGLGASRPGRKADSCGLSFQIAAPGLASRKAGSTATRDLHMNFGVALRAAPKTRFLIATHPEIELLQIQDLTLPNRNTTEDMTANLPGFSRVTRLESRVTNHATPPEAGLTNLQSPITTHEPPIASRHPGKAA